MIIVDVAQESGHATHSEATGWLEVQLPEQKNARYLTREFQLESGS